MRCAGLSTADGSLMTVDYEVRGDEFIPGKPRPWAEGKRISASLGAAYDVAPDGKRVAAFPAEDAPAGPRENLHAIFLLNFFDELKRRLP